MQICIQDSGYSVHKRTKIDLIIKIFHAKFGINRLKSLKARAASVKHKYYAKNTIKCYLKLQTSWTLTWEMGMGNGKVPMQRLDQHKWNERKRRNLHLMVESNGNASTRICFIWLTVYLNVGFFLFIAFLCTIQQYILSSQFQYKSPFTHFACANIFIYLTSVIWYIPCYMRIE